LETLILEHLNPKYIDDVLEGIASLSNLSTLILITGELVYHSSELLLRVFRLSTLKYCKLNIRDSLGIKALPFADNEHSNIEQLTLKSSVYFDELDRLLSYVPRLRRFSIDAVHKGTFNMNFSQHFH
jgi:hypothetical protein